MKEEFGGVMITLFKDRYTEEQLRKIGLNERQVKAVLYVVENGSITNSQYQQLNKVGKTVATEELQGLIEKTVMKQTGSKGRGSKYELEK